MIKHVIVGSQRDLGGFTVQRVLPGELARSVGPFVFFDVAGPTVLRPGQGIDVRPHPHIGLSTLTYLFAGEVVHRDSLGSVQAIRAGAVNWMTAGRGIVHSERSADDARASGGELHGLQAWVALPVEHEEVEPSFAHHAAEAHPTFEEDGAWGRLIAGEAFGERAPSPTFSPLFYVHWQLEPAARAVVPAGYEERAVLVVAGHVLIAGQSVGPDHLVVLAAGEAVPVTAETSATVVAFGGDPLGERYLWWNLVSSRRERIEQAQADWAEGRMNLPPGEREWMEAPDVPHSRNV